MQELLKNNLGRLRIIAFLEGLSLIILCFIATPLKYIFHNPVLTIPVGYAHGFLFILYVIYTFIVSREYQWNHFKTTWKVLLGSFIPFGTFYIDKKILSQQVQPTKN